MKKFVLAGVAAAVIAAGVMGTAHTAEAQGINELPHRSLATAMSEDLNAHATESTGRRKMIQGAPAKLLVSQEDGNVTRCTGGFVVDFKGAPHLVTAGHCANSIDATVRGTGFSRIVRDHDGRAIPRDYGLIPTSADNTTIATGDGTKRITGVIAPEVGMEVCSYGATTGWRCGVVTRVKDYGFASTLNSRHGDSGGIVVSGDKVVGISVTGRKGADSYSEGRNVNRFGSGMVRADWILEDAKATFR